MDLTARILIPFVLMSLFTILLLNEVFHLRKRIIRNFLILPTRFSVAESNKFKKDIQFATNSIVLNLAYITLSLPATVANFDANFMKAYYLSIYLLCIYIFFMSYAINFYLLLIGNSLFRREFSLSLK